MSKSAVANDQFHNVREVTAKMKTTLDQSLFLFLLFCVSGIAVSGQTFVPAQVTSGNPPKSEKKNAGSPELEEIKQHLREQQKEINQLRAMILEQSRLIENLKDPGALPRDQTAVTPNYDVSAAPPKDDVELRLGKLEEQSKKASAAIEKNRLGTIGFNGDLRMQYDSIYGLINNSANINNPAILGNELSSRQRIRFRLRFGVSGKIGSEVFTGTFTGTGEKRTDREFEWGFRLSSGSLTSPVSPNPVLTDFYSRKPFALDRAYVAWRPRPFPGLKIIAGKFEPNWSRTEMTIDNDLQVEGIGETYTRDIKNAFLKNVTLSAWQLPILERGSTFVRNADGTVNLTESRRNGRDLALFGGQIQSRFALSPNTSLTVSLANLHFANTDAINPVQVFGSQLQLPVTVTVPSGGGGPAQTLTGVALISRELLLSGNGNLGLSNSTNAAVNRNGLLSSGFNLVDLITQVDFKKFRHSPFTFIFNYVRNTKTRDVIAAGPAGGDVLLSNNEGDGIWAEFRLQNLRKTRGPEIGDPVRGDLLLGYTFLRIEKDAVLSGFNWDDLVHPSDVKAHRIFFAYTVDPRVTFNITTLFNRRLNGLLGPFRTTPPGSLDREVVRLQFDTVFKF